jgi:hypothetical protein
MTNHVFLSALDHFITSAAAGSHSQAHINRLRMSARAAFDCVNLSLASLQSSLLLLAEIERSPRSPPIRWDVYPAFPNAIRLGEIEAADQREAIERAAKKFE